MDTDYKTIENDSLKNTPQQTSTSNQEVKVETKEEKKPASSEYIAVPPEQFTCSISQDWFEEPVITPDGITHSKNSLMEWFQKRHELAPYNPHANRATIDPITRQPLDKAQLRPNRWLENLWEPTLRDQKNMEHIRFRGPRIEIEAKQIYVPAKLLNNPDTQQPFIHPVVDEKGNTVEANNEQDQKRYPNRIYKDIRKLGVEQKVLPNSCIPPLPVRSKKSPPPDNKQEDEKSTPLLAQADGYEILNNHPAEAEQFLGQQAQILAGIHHHGSEPYQILAEVKRDDHHMANPYQQWNGIRPVGNHWEGNHPGREDTDNSGAACCLLITVGAYGALSYGIYKFIEWVTNADTNPACSNLSYQFRTPWVPGGELCIYNADEFDNEIASLQFTAYAKINGSAWGALVTGNSFTAYHNPDGSTTYEIVYSNAPTGLQLSSLSAPMTLENVPIPANNKVCLQYNTQNAVANTNLFDAIHMNPTDVSVQLSEGMICHLPIESSTYQSDNSLDFQYKATATVTQWGFYQGASVDKLPLHLYNQINYVGLRFNMDDGSLSSIDPYADNWNLPQIATLKKIQAPRIKTMMSFGGYCSNPMFNKLTSNPTALENFANNVVKAAHVLQMDGVNIDWRDCNDGIYPDPSKMQLLFKQLRFISKNQPKFIISATVPGAIDKIAAISADNWCAILDNVDQVFVNSYDYNGPWSQTANYIAPMQQVTNSMEAWKNMTCIPSHKLHLGISATGRAMRVNNTDSNYGWGQPIIGTPAGQFDGTGAYNYACINGKHCGSGHPLPNDMVLFSTIDNPVDTSTSHISGAWGYSRNQSMVISFEDNISVEIKTAYAKEQYFGGIHLEAVSQDILGGKCTSTLNEKNSLSCAINQRLSTENHVTLMNQHNLIVAGNDNQPTNPVTDKLAGLFDSLPNELRNGFHQALQQGFLTTFLPMLTAEFVTDYLTKHHYTQKQIYAVNTALRGLTILYLGTWASSAATIGTHTILTSLGFSEQAATRASAVTGTVITVAASSTSFVATTAVVAGGYVGSLLAHGLFKAAKKVGARMMANDTNRLEDHPSDGRDFSPV